MMQGGNSTSGFMLCIASTRVIHSGFWNCIIDNGVPHKFGQPLGFDASIAIDRQTMTMQSSGTVFDCHISFHELEMNTQLFRVARNNTV